MQILKDEDEGLFQTLPQEKSLQRLERPPPPNLRVHLGQVRLLVVDAEQRKQIGQGVFEAAVEREYFPGD